jgi:perosamine synthetase
MNSVEEILLPEGASAYAALLLLDKTGNRFLFIVDEEGRLTGVLTDGDVRRGLLKGYDLETEVVRFMRREFVSLPVEATDLEITATLSERISFLPLLDPAGRPVDYSSLQRHRRYPVAQPLLGGNEELYVTECVRTGWISSQGRFVGDFEQALAEFHGASYALAVSNGTVALQLALCALGVGPGDEVILPALTFAATASAVIHAGAIPVFADVDATTWLMGAEQIRPLITARTRAIIPVHLYGFPAAMGAITDLAAEHGLVVVEDAAEALGASIDGKLVGTFGEASCFSFFGNKTVTTGEGGAILFRDLAAYERAKMLRDHGMDPARRYWHLEPGFNFRLTNLQAAVGVAQMERIGEILARKQWLFEHYLEAFGVLEEFVHQSAVTGGKPSCWLFTLLMAEEAAIDRDEVAARLLQNGIETRPIFFPLPAMPAFSRFAEGRTFPNAESISARGLSFPSAVALSDEDLAEICRVTHSIVRLRRLVSGSSGGR